MECKFVLLPVLLRQLLELIETLWNVNKVALIESPAQKYELIETLWNVNIAKFVMIVTPVAN